MWRRQLSTLACSPPIVSSRNVSVVSAMVSRGDSCSLRRTLPAVVGGLAKSLRAGPGATRCLGLDTPHELLASEQLDGAIELACEPRGGVLAELAHPLVERERGRLHLALELP